MDFMVDLETLGTVPGCAILSIGIVAWNPNQIIDAGSYGVVYRPTCNAVGLKVDPDTEDWWSRQSPEAQVVLAESMDQTKSVTLYQSLMAMEVYMAKHEPDIKKRFIWGNGADFDNAILQVAYGALGLKPAWEFWNNRCYRTLKSLCPSVKIDRTGTVYHNALGDSIAQALHAIEILNTPRANWAQPTA